VRFRPCIDIHNGKVKQIVGGSLKDQGDTAVENYVASRDAAWFASLYEERGFYDGHVIMLNAKDSPNYAATKEQALKALAAFPGGLQVGGGIGAGNARGFLDAGASHVIVTSWLFENGSLSEERLQALEEAVGRERVVIDLSCRKRNGAYFIVTDRWQTFTELEVTEALLEKLSGHCAEFLVHGVDAEGKSAGVETELAKLLAAWDGIPITYAGGIGSLNELEHFADVTRGKLDYTIGSALDLFGGTIPFERLKSFETPR